MKKTRRIFIVFVIILTLLWSFYPYLLSTYSQYRNAQNLADIKRVNTVAYSVFDAFIKDVEAKTDWKVLIVSGYRDEEKQAMLKKMNPKNASAGKSKHNFGKAIDISAFRRKGLFTKWLVKSSSKQAWELSQITQIAKLYNLNWGGDFSHYHDPVHFEIN
jgi:D-alanyl-D-alanine carboxypeptidase